MLNPLEGRLIWFSIVIFQVIIILYLFIGYSDNYQAQFVDLEERIETVEPGERGGPLDHNLEVDSRDITADITILILGDSFTWGRGVSSNETWPSVLDHKLGDNVKVVNLAWPGYQITDKSKLYRENGFRYKADLILIQTNVKDFKNMTLYKNKIDREVVERYNGYYTESGWQNVTEEELRDAKNEALQQYYSGISEDYRREKFRSSFNNIDENLTESQEVWIIDNNPFEEGIQEERNWRKHYAEKHDWRYRDWSNYYVPKLDSEEAKQPDSPHPSSKGHKIWAKELLKEMREYNEILT